MDESLRIAYLDAMGIPCWVPRELSTRKDNAPPTRVEGVTASPMAALRGMLSSEAPKAFSPPSTSPTDRSAGGAAQDTLAWVLIRAGSCLIIDELPDSGYAASLREFHIALGYALTGKRQDSGVQEFRWPPYGQDSLDQGMLSDAIAGRFSALRQEGNLDCLALMGEGILVSLKTACPDLLTACRVSLHPPGAAIMTDAGAKRMLWAALVPAVAGIKQIA